MEMKGWAFQIDAGAGAKEWTFGRSRQNLPNTKKKNGWKVKSQTNVRIIQWRNLKSRLYYFLYFIFDGQYERSAGLTIIHNFIQAYALR